MNQDKMHLINQIFNNETIRTVWDKEKYYISVVDIIAILTDSSNPRHYWNVLKARLKEEGNETVTNCDQLKLKAQDGKYRLTDIWNEHGVNTEIEYAILTNEIYKGWSSMNASEYKAFKGIRKENLRDNMSNIELALANLGEAATEELVKVKNPNGLEENKNSRKVWGGILQKLQEIN